MVAAASPARRTPLPARLLPPLLVALATPLLLFPRGDWPYLGLGLLAAAWALEALVARRLLPRTPLALPAAAILLAALVGLYPSPDRALSLPRLCGLVAGVAVYFATAHAVTTRRRFWLGCGLLVAAVVPVATLGLVGTQWSLKFPLLAPLYERIPRLISQVQATSGATTYFNPNELGGTLAFLLPLPLALLLGGRLRPLPWLAVAFAFVVGLAVFVLAASRTAYAALALTTLGLLIWRWRRAGLAVALPLLAAAAFAASQVGLAALEPPDDLASLGETFDSLPLGSRQPIWAAALRLLADFPFTGIGLNTFDAVLQGPLSPLPAGGKLVHAHNVFLQTALDLGLGGLMAFLALCGGAAVLGLRAHRRLAADATRRPTAAQAAVAGLLASLAAYLLFGLADAVTLGAKPTVLVWLLLGLVAAAGFGESAGRPPRARRWRLVPAALAVVAVAVASPLWLSALHVNLGRVALARFDYATALAHAGQALGWQAGNSRAHLLAGLVHAQLGDDRQAVAALARAVALDPPDSQAHFLLAEAHHRLGADDAAVEHWRAAGAVDVLLKRAAQARSAQDLGAAARWYDLATRSHPAGLPAWLGLAQTLAAAELWQAAAEGYAQMIDRFPTSYLGYEGRANLLYNRLQDRPGALAILDAGIERATDPKQLYYLRSVYLAGYGFWPAAEADAKQAIALAPANGSYLAWLGDLYYRQKRYDEAIAQYQVAADEASDRTWLWRAAQKVGTVHAACKEWDAAMAAFRAAVAISVEQGARANVVAANYVQLGAQLAQADRRDEAAEAYRQALALDPANRDAQKRLEDLLKQGK